jgi:hypothetical protein
LKRQISNEVKKDTYLQYLGVYLSQEDQNGALFRAFIDCWYAYSKGGAFLNRNGNPKWFNNPHPVRERNALLSMDYISAAAMELIYQNETEGRLVKDHSVPIKVLRKMIVDKCGNKISDLARIEEFLEKYYRLGVITKDEDRLFGGAGLISEMPNDWDEEDAFARYRAVGINEARLSREI